MTDAAADPKLEVSGGRKLSLVWLAPLAAIAVALFLLWNEFQGRGPVIQIKFPTADGISADETALRYRSVEVGRVEALRFADDLSEVIADVRVDPKVAKFIDADAQFWVVQPEISVTGISGLETVISGVYIEGAWDKEPGEKQRVFSALKDPPLTPLDTPGRRVTLLASDGGSLSVGAPILYRGVEVGRVEARHLTEDGSAVEFDIFVAAPNDKRLTKATRFWNVSGVDLSFGADGARLRIASLASLVQGGATFEELSGGAAEEVSAGHVFNLYPSEADARSQALDVEPGERLLLDVYFNGSVRGLSVGAPVEYQGIRIGRVTSVTAEVDPEEGLFSTRTTIAIAPSRLGLEDGDVPGSLAFLDKAVARGVRAQLATANLLTGALLVRLVPVDFPPGAERGEILRREGRPPRLPATQTDLDELAGSVEGALKRIERLPIEQLLSNAVLLLENVNAVIGTEETRQIPEKTLAAIASLETLLSSDALQSTPDEALALLKSLRKTVESEEIERARVDLAALLSNAREITDTLAAENMAGEAAATLAALRERLEDPALASLAASVTKAVDAASAVLETPAILETPQAINEALASLRRVLDAPGLVDAPAELNETLAAARGLLDEFAEKDTAGEIAAAATAARALIEDPALVRLAEETAGAAEALRLALGADGAERLPEATVNALNSMTALLDQLRAEDLGPKATETLASINRASNVVSAALAETPRLMRSLSAAAEKADGMLASLDVGSELNYEAVTAIREIRDAARAITNLAALIERRPNSFIFGR